MTRVLAVVGLLGALCAPSASAQINGMTIPFVFTPGAVIASSEVNTNFGTLFTNAVDRTNGVLLGTLQTRAIQPTADGLYDLGTPNARFRNLYVTGFIGGTGQTTFTGTSGDQLTVGYNSQQKWTTRVNSTGTTTFTAAGTTPKFVFTSAVEFAGGATGIVGVVPTGMVAFFDLPACPAGWAEYGTGAGRYIVGIVGTDATVGAASATGTALDNMENRATGRHTHTVSGVPNWGSPEGVLYTGNENPGNLITGTKDAYETSATGAQSDTNAPYIQLRICKKS